MFYSQFILAKKGPLGTIWIAAHLERKLRKNQVTETNIGVSVDSILFPEVPIALRLSGHLLLGVVRIYSRKVNYLFHDCSEALVKIKQAFHAGAVDLPPEAATAPFHSITLPETFDLDEFEPLLDKELNLLHSNGAVDHHVSSREQITLQDPLEDSTYLGSAQFELDERFPDADAPRLGMDFDEDLLDKPTREASPAMDTLEEDFIPPPTMGDALDYDQMDRMDPMDVDEQNEPVTPGLGVDMALDYQRENDELEGDLERDPDELERLEPNLQIDNDELDNLQVEGEQLASLEPVTPGLAPEKDEGERPLDEEAVEGTPEQQEEREELAADINKPEDEETAGKPTEEEAVSGQFEKETVQGQVGGETSMVEEENLQGLAEEPGLELKAAEEGMAGGRQETELEEHEKLSEGEKVGIEHEKGNDQEEVPEYEKVMSAPEAGSQDPDVFDLDNSVNLQQGAASSYQDRREFPELEKDSNLRLDDETLPVIPEEDPESAMADKMSPLRSPPFPAISSSDLPGDDDVLATLLGRGTPAITVQPTPVETTVTKPRRKQGQRKRKTVMDMMTILGADVMKQQLMNTDDIRRVRRKAPCTRQDLWNVQKDALGQQIFCEQSVPGLCGEIRSLFERVYVVGEANLPLAEDSAVDAAAGEQMIEPPLATVVDDMNIDVNRMDPQAAELGAEGGDIQDIADVHRHDEGVEGLDENVSRSPRSPHAAEGVPDEGAQSVPSPTAVAAVQEEEGPQSSPKGNEEPVEAAPVMDLNSESLEMAEATDKDTSKHGDVALIDVNKENPRTEEGDAEVVHGEAVVPPADVVTGPESQGFQVEVPSEFEAEAEDTIAPATILDAEFAARVAEAEAVVGKESDIERGLELHPVLESGTEAGNEAESEAVDKAGADAEVVRADVHAEEAVVLEALPEGGIGDTEGQDPGQAVILPEKEAEEEVEGRTAADMEVDAPQAQSPPVEEFGFVETRDTEFLGADDDDLDEEAEDFQDVNEYARREAAAHDNSGWSARTRAVGHYLRITLEDKDAYMKKRKEEGTAKLGLERMLVGKSRKEAARMFFETLVLKTKDYIHVEQDTPYGDIQISARPKLLKAKF